LRLSGVSPDQLLVEMVELPNHPYFIGCQFHPEFKSKPHAPHPLFTNFIRAAHAYAHARPRPKDEALHAELN
jgi:CTP synthase